jgi:hypothetical protein
MGRWAKLLIGGVVLVILQWVFPDLVAEGINDLLGRPDISLYTGLGTFLKVLLVLWKASGGALVIGGIVDWFRTR